jgi:hypothetical protein
MKQPISPASSLACLANSLRVGGERLHGGVSPLRVPGCLAGGLRAHSGDLERSIRSIMNTDSGDHEHPLALA